MDRNWGVWDCLLPYLPTLQLLVSNLQALTPNFLSRYPEIDLPSRRVGLLKQVNEGCLLPTLGSCLSQLHHGHKSSMHHACLASRCTLLLLCLVRVYRLVLPATHDTYSCGVTVAKSSMPCALHWRAQACAQHLLRTHSTNVPITCA